MGIINRSKKSRFRDLLFPRYQPAIASPDAEKGTHLNWMGGPSFDIQDPLVQLQVAASSCFFGEPMYYHRDGGDTRPDRSRLLRARLSDSDLDHLRRTLEAIDPAEWRGLSPADLMVRAIDRALDHDPEATLEFAAHLRSKLMFRTTPRVLALLTRGDR